MRVTYVGDCSEGVEVDGLVVLPGGSCELPDDAAVNPAVWRIEKPVKGKGE